MPIERKTDLDIRLGSVAKEIGALRLKNKTTRELEAIQEPTETRRADAGVKPTLTGPSDNKR
jgi:hypothetical protein